jgi:hypothetical protein
MVVVGAMMLTAGTTGVVMVMVALPDILEEHVVMVLVAVAV